MKHAILGLIILLSVQSSYAADNISISAKQIASLGITTTTLPTKQSGEFSGLPAQVVIPANQLFIISAPLAGMIEQTLAGVGDTVKKGQIIASIQSPGLAEAQRGLLETSVRSQLARENLSRDASLFKEGIISGNRYHTARGLALEAQAAFSERRQLLRLSGMSDRAISQLQSDHHLNSQLTLTSPADGVVLEKSANAGQRIDVAVPIFKIARIDQLSLEIQAPLSIARDLKIGSTITVPAFAASGKLTAIGRSLTGANQTVLLRGIILQGADNLRPGQFVEVSIGTTIHSDAQWEIPNRAISRIEGRSVIFVQTAQGFHAQTIHIINEGAKNSVISGALKGDEKIAIAGVSALKSSMMGIGEVQ
jgi:RND family efflux transporter MFP subunit